MDLIWANESYWVEKHLPHPLTNLKNIILVRLTCAQACQLSVGWKELNYWMRTSSCYEPSGNQAEAGWGARRVVVQCDDETEPRSESVVRKTFPQLATKISYILSPESGLEIQVKRLRHVPALRPCPVLDLKWWYLDKHNAIELKYYWLTLNPNVRHTPSYKSQTLMLVTNPQVNNSKL